MSYIQRDTYCKTDKRDISTKEEEQNKKPPDLPNDVADVWRRIQHVTPEQDATLVRQQNVQLKFLTG